MLEAKIDMNEALELLDFVVSQEKLLYMLRSYEVLPEHERKALGLHDFYQADAILTTVKNGLKALLKLPRDIADDKAED